MVQCLRVVKTLQTQVLAGSMAIDRLASQEGAEWLGLEHCPQILSDVVIACGVLDDALTNLVIGIEQSIARRTQEEADHRRRHENAAKGRP